MCCEKSKGCQKPKELKTTPKECTPEQIRKCHGDDAGHPCVKEEKKKEEA
jgi:hypothetical protein